MANGSQWRLRERHPRRDMPLEVFVKDEGGGMVKLGEPGDTCEGLDDEVLESLIRNDYVERVPEPVLRNLNAEDAIDVVSEAPFEDLPDLRAEEAGRTNPRVTVLRAIDERLDEGDE